MCVTGSAFGEERESSDAAAWLAVGGMLLLVLAIQIRHPLPIEPRGFLTLAAACGGLGCAAWFYTRVRIRKNFAITCLALMQALLFSAFGCILSYMLARTGGPLWDERFVAWDRALGLDWLAYVRLVDSLPWLVQPLRLAYGSLIPQLIVLLLAFGFSGRFRELRIVVLAAIFSGTATVLLSPFFPAVSSYVHLGLTADNFQNLNPWAGYAHLQHFTALRDGSIGQVGLAQMEGIITFPSYHAGLSTVTLYGFWMTRIGWLRWPGVTVAVATILATPVDGGHYFVDVLAGVVLGIVGLAASKSAVGWIPARLPLTALPFPRSRAASAR